MVSKRLVPSILIGFLSLTAMLGGFGFVNAADPSETQIPTSWVVPDMRVGDRGIYSLTIVKDLGLSIEVLQDERIDHGFWWLEPTRMIDAEGDFHDVHVMQESHVRDDNVVANIAYHMDRTDRSLAAYTYDSSMPRVQADGTWVVGDQNSYSRQVNTVADDDIFVTECGGNPALAGQTIQPASWPVLLRPCAHAEYWSQNEQFRPIGIEPLGDTTALHMASWRGFGQTSHATHLWLSQDLPYPVRMVFQSQEAPQEYHVYRLVSYRAGSGDVISWGDGEPATPTEVDMAPRGPNGPDVEGFELAFPLDEAREAARGHAGAGNLRAYLDDHPDAVVVRASVSTSEDDGVNQWNWYVELTDGFSGFAYHIIRDDAAPAGGLLGLFPEEASNDRYQDGNPTLDRWWPMEAMPATLPRIADMANRWEELAGGPFQGKQANHWSMSMWCGYDPCTEPVVSVEVGFQLDEDGLRQESVLEWYKSRNSPDGGEWEWMESMAQGAGKPAGTGDRSTGQSDVAIDAGALAITRALWRFPVEPGTLAGASILSALGALFYYFWPLLKSSGLALFSRVTDPDALLEHPVRRQMVDAIEADPGIHIRQLSDRLGLGRGSTDHHLRKLEGARLVTRVQQDGYGCLFLRGAMDRRMMAAAPVLKADGARRLLAAIVLRPGSAAADLARSAKLGQGTVNYHMKRLEAAGMVALERDGARVRLFPTELAHQVVAT